MNTQSYFEKIENFKNSNNHGISLNSANLLLIISIFWLAIHFFLTSELRLDPVKGINLVNDKEDFRNLPTGLLITAGIGFGFIFYLSYISIKLRHLIKLETKQYIKELHQTNDVNYHKRVLKCNGEEQTPFYGFLIAYVPRNLQNDFLNQNRKEAFYLFLEKDNHSLIIFRVVGTRNDLAKVESGGFPEPREERRDDMLVYKTLDDMRSNLSSDLGNQKNEKNQKKLFEVAGIPHT